MYCPSCGTNNLEGAKFCRSCGADISLVPQALMGRLPESQSVVVEDTGRRGRRHKGEPSLEKAIKNIFMGLGFLIVTIVLAFTPMGRAWWFWMFIPAFSMLGGGLAEWLRLKHAETRALPRASTRQDVGSLPPPPLAAAELPRRNTAELIMQPPSITEGTTRHLGEEAPTRHIGRGVENHSSKTGADS